MDRSQTLTVWAFLATEGGANKVKRGLKNVTLSVECGPLTVNAPLSQAPRPHDARFRSPPSLPLFLSCEVSSCATYLATGTTRSREPALLPNRMVALNRCRIATATILNGDPSCQEFRVDSLSSGKMPRIIPWIISKL